MENNTETADPTEQTYPFFPNGYRRRVVGETTGELDLCCDYRKTGRRWEAATPGRVIALSNPLTYVCAQAIHVDAEVVEIAMATFNHMMCDNGYMLEMLVTADCSAPSCRCCGAPGEWDAEALGAIIDSQAADGNITADEFDELGMYEDADHLCNAYLDIRARYARDSVDLPDIPFMYEHTLACDAVNLRHTLDMFSDIFWMSLEAKYGCHDANKLTDNNDAYYT